MWSCQSPHLNPIKNLWGELKREISKTVAKTNSSYVETCRMLVSSTPGESEKVTKNSGGYLGQLEYKTRPTLTGN